MIGYSYTAAFHLLEPAKHGFKIGFFLLRHHFKKVYKKPISLDLIFIQQLQTIKFLLNAKRMLATPLWQ